MKNSNDTIGNRTRELPVCSAVPQPTALPRAPYAVRYSLFVLGYKRVQHVTVLNTVGKCNTVGSFIILYYNNIARMPVPVAAWSKA